MSPKAVVSVLAVMCVWCAQECACFSNGSVAFSCGSMEPGHSHYDPAPSPAPYKLSVSSSTYMPGGLVTVTMGTVGSNSKAFQGFLLQARGSGGQVWPVGKFTNINTTLLTALACGGMENSSVSQASSAEKTEVQLTWKAPNSSNYGDICFSATFVQSYSVFWVRVNSSVLKLDGNGNVSGSAAKVFSSLTGSCVALMFLFVCY